MNAYQGNKFLNVHFLGLYWDNTVPSFFVRKDKDSDKEFSIILNKNQKLSIEITGDKYCPGYYHPIKNLRYNCPFSKKILNKNKSQCSYCFKKGGGFVASTGTKGNIDKEIEAFILNSPHYLYLNLFPNNIIKVGVTREQRYLNRILEQGAIATLFIAKSNGESIRDLEKEISLKFGLPEKIGYNLKLQILNYQISENRAKEILFDKYQEIISVIKKKIFLKNPLFFFNLEKFMIDFSKIIPSIYVIKNINIGSVISGEIVGIVGDFLIFRNYKEENWAIQANKLLSGHLINLFLNEVKKTSFNFQYETLKLKETDKKISLF